jgi:hypothetical protein
MRLALVLLTTCMGLWGPAITQQLQRLIPSRDRTHVVEVNLTTVLIPATVFRKDDDTVVGHIR